MRTPLINALIDAIHHAWKEEKPGLVRELTILTLRELEAHDTKTSPIGDGYAHACIKRSAEIVELPGLTHGVDPNSGLADSARGKGVPA